MCKMLLSINPEYVKSILEGEKVYEYRKFRCREDVNKIVKSVNTSRYWGFTCSSIISIHLF